MPFYPIEEYNSFPSAMWQNSSIRGYLNGYNVNNIQNNGHTAYPAPNGGDFSQYNFLSQAFDYNNDLVKNIPDINENMNIMN